MKGHHWMDFARCRLDPTWTTMDHDGGWINDRRRHDRELVPRRAQMEHLVAICESCPVIADCARYALDEECNGGMYAGVWIPLSGRTYGNNEGTLGYANARRILARRAAGDLT